MKAASNISLPLDCFLDTPEADELLRRELARALGTGPDELGQIAIVRRSVDARRRGDVHFVCKVEAYGPDETPAAREPFAPLIDVPSGGALSTAVPSGGGGLSTDAFRPVVVGSGPAGLFAALALAQAGLAPLVIERGSRVDERVRKIERFQLTGELDPECNVQFGEGGAGTFSDGKLNTGTHNPHIRRVLETFVDAGASPDILVDAKPHVGTDVLRGVVVNIRRQIERLGGEFRFDTRLADVCLDGSGALEAIVLESDASRYELPCTTLVLAIGHSARDTYRMLATAGLDLEAKAFAIGVRAEHPQAQVDRALYHGAAGHPALGAAPYKFVTHLDGALQGRSVYSFCMCPGGVVVPAASEDGGVVTNGMSYSARNAVNANAALLVNVTPDDYAQPHNYAPTHPLECTEAECGHDALPPAARDALRGLAFQRSWEQAAFEAGGGAHKAPAQRWADFLAGCPSTQLGSVEASYARGVTPGTLDACLPTFVTEALRAGLPAFDAKLRFANPDALLTGIETRSSSPVRIPRSKETLQASIPGIYPCGEGGGHAGGIVSSAVDGIRVAQAILDATR